MNINLLLNHFKEKISLFIPLFFILFLTTASHYNQEQHGNIKKTSVINKRAAGSGLISGRKAFQRPMAEGIELLNAIQDVYLSKEIDIA